MIFIFDGPLQMVEETDTAIDLLSALLLPLPLARVARAVEAIYFHVVCSGVFTDGVMLA